MNLFGRDFFHGKWISLEFFESNWNSRRIDPKILKETENFPKVHDKNQRNFAISETPSPENLLFGRKKNTKKTITNTGLLST